MVRDISALASKFYTMQFLPEIHVSDCLTGRGMFLFAVDEVGQWKEKRGALT